MLKYFVFSLLTTQSLLALTVLNVTENSDNNPGSIGNPGELRYCLNTMNLALNTTPDDYAIVFDSPMTIQLNGILPIINNSSNPVNITIGNPDSIVTLDGNNGAYSGFFIPIGNVTIQNMTFQNLTAKGGDGGNGISGAGGGLGAGGAIYAPQSFLNGSYPFITLSNVAINNCSAIGGNGGSYIGLTSTGNEGGGGGGGSGLGAAIFVDSYLNFTIQALAGVSTTFNTLNNTTQAGTHGTSGPGAFNGTDGSALGNSIFLRQGASLSLLANHVNDLLTLGSGVSFMDDTAFGAGGTTVFVEGDGTVVYNGTTDYQGSIMINNANFQVNGQIENASIYVCRNTGFSEQRGALSGSGVLTGDVFVNSGIISPASAKSITLGSLSLSSTDFGAPGSLVHIDINSTSKPSVVAVNGPASLAGVLEITLDPNAQLGSYIILTSSAVTGAFDSVIFTGSTPNYSITYGLTFVQLNFLGYPINLYPAANLQGKQKRNDFGLQYELYNQLKWEASPSPDVIGYNIYRDGSYIASVDASTLSYKDHNRKKKVPYTYAITAFNSNGSESTPVNIVITP